MVQILVTVFFRNVIRQYCMRVWYAKSDLWLNALYYSMLTFESYSHNSDEVTLRWMDNAITLMKPIQLPDFDLIAYHPTNETMNYPNGYWDQLRVSVTKTIQITGSGTRTFIDSSKCDAFSFSRTHPIACWHLPVISRL